MEDSQLHHPHRLCLGNLPLVGCQPTTAYRAILGGQWREPDHCRRSNAASRSRSTRYCNGHPVNIPTSPFVASLTTFRPLLQKLGSPRIPIALGMLVGAAAYVLMIFSEGRIHDNEYWRWYVPALMALLSAHRLLDRLVPAFIIGSGATMMSFLGTK